MQDRGYSGVGLFNPKFDVNVGSALRAVQAYKADFIAYTGKRFRASKALTNTGKAHRHIPLFHTTDLRGIIPFGCVPVAVELVTNAHTICNYIHPERAIYIFGPEDGTLGQKVLSWCRDIIYVPTAICMNLAATVNVVLYDRMSKIHREQQNFSKLENFQHANV
jgi:tRNA(Leu) C34 or U34 (ribose-2'-O)-methylase TrmL